MSVPISKSGRIQKGVKWNRRFGSVRYGELVVRIGAACAGYRRAPQFERSRLPDCVAPVAFDGLAGI
jgi:hypothetical protein